MIFFKRLRISKKLKKIKLLVLDFDGILTDGKVIFGQDGYEMVVCSRKDGLGTNLLQKHGIEVCVLSKETNPVVSERCKKMRIECYQKIEDGDSKAVILKRVAGRMGLDLSQVAYMEDDLTGVAPMKLVGLAITVADGHPKVKKVADLITAAAGGNHAVREVAEKILEAQGVNISRY